MTTARDPGGVRRPAPGAGVRQARGGRALALGGRLDRRHERHARGHDPPALLLRRRRLARPRADADARDRRAPRGGDPRVQARSPTGSSTRRSSRATASRAARYDGPLPRRRAAAAEDGRGGRGDRRRRPRPGRRDHQARDDDASKERAPLLYDLTSLQRDANTRFGFSARRTLAAAQRLYEEHKALTYPRTNSRFLPRDMVGEIKPIGRARRRAAASTPRAAAYVTGLDVLPLGRVVNDAKVTDHHAIIPTRAEHRVDKMSDDDKRVYDLVARRFLAVFHPDAVFENTRLETTVAEHVFRTRGRVLLVPGWRGVYGEGAGRRRAGETDETRARPARCPSSSAARRVDTREVAAAEKETKPPRRYSRRLAARRDGDRRQARRRRRAARGDEGLGHRHAGHARGDHRAPDRRRLHRARRPRARRAPRRA